MRRKIVIGNLKGRNLNATWIKRNRVEGDVGRVQ
jgi:hypothetical protein